MFRQQSVATYEIVFLLADTAGDPVTGATPTVTVRKNAGSFAAASSTIGEVANGVYRAYGAGLTTDLNTLGPTVFHIEAAGALDVDMIVEVVPYDPFGSALPATVADKTGYSLATTGMDAVTLPANIITASSIAADAISEIQSGLATQVSLDDVPTTTELTAGIVAVIAAGDARWLTATGFATSGALSTLQTTADAILVDTGTTLPAQIAGISGGGGGTVSVTPLSAGDVQRITGTTITAYIDEVSPITVYAITDANGDAVDLSALPLTVHIEDQHHNVIESIADPTISGVDDNDFTFNPDAATVAQARQLIWSLRINSTDYVLAHGSLDIKYAARG